MVAAIIISVLGSLAFIAWMIFRAVREKSIKAHTVCYGIAVLTGIFTYGYFISLDFAWMLKVVVSIVIGVALIFAAAGIQQRSR